MVTRKVFSVVQAELSGSAETTPDAETGSASEDAPDETVEVPSDDGQPSRWNQLFKESDSTPAATPARPANSDQGKQAEPPAPTETPTETARRALGLFSSPAATEEPRQNAVEFMANYLREKPEAGYREVREAAETGGYTVSSATFGRAQAIVGILEDAESEAAAPAGPSPAEATAAPARRALRGRRAKDPASLLEDFIDAWEGTSGESGKMKEALSEMLKVVDHALERS